MNCNWYNFENLGVITINHFVKPSDLNSAEGTSENGFHERNNSDANSFRERKHFESNHKKRSKRRLKRQKKNTSSASGCEESEKSENCSKNETTSPFEQGMVKGNFWNAEDWRRETTTNSDFLLVSESEIFACQKELFPKSQQLTKLSQGQICAGKPGSHKNDQAWARANAGKMPSQPLTDGIPPTFIIDSNWPENSSGIDSEILRNDSAVLLVNETRNKEQEPVVVSRPITEKRWIWVSQTIQDKIPPEIQDTASLSEKKNLYDGRDKDTYMFHVVSKETESIPDSNLYLNTSPDFKIAQKQENGGPTDIDNHLEVYHPKRSGSIEQILVCEYCAKRFPTKSEFRRHLLCFTGIKTVMCQICLKWFATKATLKIHMKTHGKKQFMCKVCGWRFHRRQQLFRHSVMHTGERPFECFLCERTYTTKGALGVHKRQKHGFNEPTRWELHQSRNSGY